MHVSCEASSAVWILIVVVWIVKQIVSKAYTDDSEEHGASFFRL
jgi:hypothetical protein